MNTTSVLVRPIAVADLALLDERFPEGPTDKHHSRLDRQSAGQVTYLVAWHDAEPLGHALIVWAGATHREVKLKIKDCPEIDDLFVAEAYRSQSVGTALLRAAEQAIESRHYRQAGLAVGRQNPRAQALYQRLGDEECGLDDIWLAGMWMDRQGVEQFWGERCRYLIKHLTPSPLGEG